MPIDIRMPALSPTMEQGKLSRWLVKAGDIVASGDILAEIETDKATMEFEAVDEGTITELAVAEGTEGVKVGTVIATLVGEDEAEGEAGAAQAHPQTRPQAGGAQEEPALKADKAALPFAGGASDEQSAAPTSSIVHKENRVIASPLAKRLAADKGVDLAALTGSGPHGRIIKANVDAAMSGTAGAALAAVPETAAPPPAAPRPPAPTAAASSPTAPAPAAAPAPVAVKMAEETRALLDAAVPHTVSKLSGMRKTIARRLAQSMSQAPHIYLTVDIRLDRLLALRAEMNAALVKTGVKLSVNDMLIKALGKALIDVPECNVTFAGNELISYSRADVSVAVSIPGGLITPIIRDASGRSLSSIAQGMKDLGARAKEGKLLAEEYQGGTASISNMGMMGIKQFTAVINPPQSTILAIGAGEQRPWVMPDGTPSGSLGVATVMSATGSFDHRAVDGADGARLMAAFRGYVESPLGMVA